MIIGVTVYRIGLLQRESKEACQILSDSKHVDAVQGYEMDPEAWTPRGNLKDTLALVHWEKALRGKDAATGNTQKVTPTAKIYSEKRFPEISQYLRIWHGSKSGYRYSYRNQMYTKQVWSCINCM
jgi:hypothetical protein